ncbi:MAG: Trehalose/maltose import ATP-binding protein MalK [Methanoregulaceae archaeon PtaU1.Bin059]|nr:MAG: Trehalose/maltose import ATP-binding protein MalK [Methanoregulaceae archaeon PtaB.Bin152]OPY43404.1 MAG: Trehalose/maltose import ATP-binding protein MalK [Methanoregulaceae archaeon PtaU1.Bin059]
MIELVSVCKRFGGKEVLRDLTFSVQKGEIFTLIGPSGTGKTTILRLINMLDDPTSGTILIDGRDTKASEGERVMLRRRMSVVFQKPAALRGNVYENVALGLKFRGTPAGEVRQRVSEALGLVGLEGYEERNATTLSGGELQRVAIARALVSRPEILLMDEPTANLDPGSTERIENLILTQNRQFGTTIVLSTHDMIQGQRLATRIAVILDRELRQVGDSREIFYHPGSREVARMVGVENIFDGRIIANEEGLASIDVGGFTIFATCPYPAGSSVTVFIRPEELLLLGGEKGRSSARNNLLGTISRVTPIGPNIRIQVDAGVLLVAVITRRSYDDLGLSPGAPVYCSFKASALHVVERVR